MRVRIFRNLTRRCLSIQARTATGWRTVAHASHAVLDRPEFVVSETGRQRVIATGRKAVHAFVVGDLRGWSGAMRPEFVQAPEGALLDLPGAMHAAPLPVPVTYNPRTMASFTRRDDAAPVRKAARAAFSPLGVTCDRPAA